MSKVNEHNGTSKSEYSENERCENEYCENNYSGRYEDEYSKNEHCENKYSEKIIEEQPNMKILCIGDPHFKCGNAVETNMLNFRTIELIQEHRPKAVVIMGDILHTNERIHVNPFIRATKYFNNILSADDNLELYVLIGNHDMANQNTFLCEEHPFFSIKNLNSRMTIVDHPIIKMIDGYRFMFLPYLPPGRFIEACEIVMTIDEIADTVSTIFCHQEFTGADLSIINSDVEQYPSKMPLCVAGHIHKFHTVADNLIYLGTPYQQTFAEDTDKALMMLNYFEDSIDYERFTIEGIPKKHNLVLSTKEFENFSIDNNFDHYKIEVHGNAGELKALKMTEKHQLLHSNPNVKFIYTTLEYKVRSKELEKAIAGSLISFKKRLELFLQSDDKCDEYNMYKQLISEDKNSPIKNAISTN